MSGAEARPDSGQHQEFRLPEDDRRDLLLRLEPYGRRIYESTTQPQAKILDPYEPQPVRKQEVIEVTRGLILPTNESCTQFVFIFDTGLIISLNVDLLPETYPDMRRDYLKRFWLNTDGIKLLVSTSEFVGMLPNAVITARSDRPEDGPIIETTVQKAAAVARKVKEEREKSMSEGFQSFTTAFKDL